MPRRDVVILDMTVEEAIKMVMSGGIVTPPDRRSAEKRGQPQVAAKTYEDVDVLREKENVPILVSKDLSPHIAEGDEQEAKDDKPREDA